MSGFNDECPSIMIIDDTPENLSLLVDVLQNSGYQVFAFASGSAALNAMQQNPPDLILLDIYMPDMDGYTVCKRIKANAVTADIPVIFLSGLTNTEEKMQAFRAGGVDCIPKPFQVIEVEARVKNHLAIRALTKQLQLSNCDLEKLALQQAQEIEDSQMSTILVLAKLAEFREHNVGNHLTRIQEYCRLLAKGLVLTDYAAAINDQFITTIYNAAPLHDIGKVAIADAILLKPGKLTTQEFTTMQAHTRIGARSLAEIHKKYSNNYFIGMGIEIARWHHERWDGGGYPDGLVSEKTPLAARIMKLVDVYDALRDKRCYKKEVDHTTACQIIYAGAETEFDPILVTTFNRLEKNFADIYGRFS